MRRFLVCSGVSSRPKGLEWLRRGVEARQPQAVLFAGGVLDGSRHYAVRNGTAWGMSRDDSLFVERFFESLGKLGIFCAVIPGPTDTPLGDFLRIGMHAEIDFPRVHVVHGALVTERDVAVCGMGGILSDGPAYDKDCCSRTITEYHLRPLWTAKQPHRILLLPAPPPGPLGGHEGRPLMGDLIDSYHPSLCVVGGPSERRGAERIASTLVINPGHLAEGWAAFLDWNLPVDEQVEFLNLRAPDHAAATVETGTGD